MNDVLWILWAAALFRVRKSKNCDAERAGAILFEELAAGRLKGAGEPSLECPAANTVSPEPAPDWEPQFIEQISWSQGEWLPDVPALKLPDRVISNLYVDHIGLARLGFKSLTAALADCFNKEWADWPDELRQRAKRANPLIPWKSLDADQWRQQAFLWDVEHDPANEQDQRRMWKLNCKIAKWETRDTPTALDLKAQESRIAVLQQELEDVSNRVAARTLGSTTMTAAEMREQSAAPTPSANHGPIAAPTCTTPAVTPEVAEATSSLETRTAGFPHPVNGKPPTYEEPPTYSADQVPKEFKDWASEQHRRGITITVPSAQDVMQGPKKNGNRSGGLLAKGPGLARKAIRAWVKSLDYDWIAHQGEPPSRSGKT